MRLILALLAASIAWGQPTVSSTTPVVVEWPSTFMRFNDNVSSGYLFGDTLYFMVDQHGHKYFNCNDCRWNTFSPISNVQINKASTYSNTTPNSNDWFQWSSGAFYSAYTYTETTSPNCGWGCTVRSRGPFCMAPGGFCYFTPDMEGPGDGNPQASSIVRTDNIDASPPLWKNPANLAGGGNSNGDMPNWTAEDSSVMFKAISGTSATSLTLPFTGSKAFTTSAGLNFAVGNSVFGYSASNTANNIAGLVTAYSGTTLTINVTSSSAGVATVTDWVLGRTNPFGHILPIIPGNFVTNGSDCPVVPVSMGGDGAGTYAYFYSDDGLRLYGPHRVSCANLPNLTASDWETWTGSAWSANLTLTQKISDLCWCSGGLYGIWLPGTSFNITLLPDLGVVVGVGQVYKYTYTALPVAAYNPALQAATATSIFGPFTLAPAGQLPTDTFQTGTNPRTRKLTGNLGLSSPGASDTIAVDVPYLQGLEPQETAFLITIGAETMRTNFATLAATIDATSWPVIRGVNGSTTTHAIGDEVQAPIRNLMDLASFVPGTYTYANGRACIDMSADIGQSDGTANDNTKAAAVYTGGINIMCFQRAPQQKTNIRGNTPIRLGTGHLGKLAFDSTHLVNFMDFNDHAGNVYYGRIQFGALNQINLLQPGDLVGSLSCTPATNPGAGVVIQWSTVGLNFNQFGGYQPRCTTTGNFPITGAGARSVTSVFRTTDISGSPVIYELDQAGGQTNKQFDAFVTAGGAWANFFDTNGLTTANSLIAINTWYAVTSTYGGGALDGSSGAGTGFNVYINGVYSCGPAGLTACSFAGSSTAVLNTNASPIQFGGISPYAQTFTGDHAAFIIHNARLSTPEVGEFYSALRAAYARRGIVLPALPGTP